MAVDTAQEDRVMAFGLAILKYDAARVALAKASKEYDRLNALVTTGESNRAFAWAENVKRIVKE